MIAQSIKENQHLARIGMVTFLGDFISLFAILLLLEKSGFGPEYAGISIVFQAAAYALSALSYPYLSSKFNTKQLIILSQLFSLFFACIILIMYLIGKIELVPMIASTTALTFCYQIFDNAKNHHSKLLNLTNVQHANNESQILSYFFGSQTIGPIISVILLKVFPVWIPLVFDIITFIICIIMAFRLQIVNVVIVGSSILKPLIYIWKYPKLRNITLLRSIGFWFGAGIFDYLMFPQIQNSYGISIINVAFVYSALGFGASLGIALIRNPLSGRPSVLARIPIWGGACIGNLGMAAAMIMFWNQKTFMMCLLVTILHGIFMGILAASSQSIRKIESTPEQFPEIISLEILLGRLTAFFVPLVIFSSIIKTPNLFEIFKYIPAVSSLVLALIYIFCFGRSESKAKK